MDDNDCPGYDPMSYNAKQMRKVEEVPKMSKIQKEKYSHYSRNLGIGEPDPASMFLCGILGILFVSVILLVAVAVSNTLFCNFMGVRDDGQAILSILGIWGVAIPSIIYIWYQIDTRSDSK